MRKITKLTAAMLSLTMLTACGANADSNSSAPEKAEYIQITQAEAKSIIDSGEEHIILDVNKRCPSAPPQIHRQIIYCAN